MRGFDVSVGGRPVDKKAADHKEAAAYAYGAVCDMSVLSHWRVGSIQPTFPSALR